MIFMECFGELPYGVGYQKKHIRPHGEGWGPLLYPAPTSPSWLNFFYKAKIGVFLFFPVFHHRTSSDVFSIIVSYQDEHLHNKLCTLISHTPHQFFIDDWKVHDQHDDHYDYNDYDDHEDPVFLW